MNNSKQDILNNLIKEPFINQRILAAQTGHSLGIVNRSIKELISEGYLDEEMCIRDSLDTDHLHARQHPRLHPGPHPLRPACPQRASNKRHRAAH